MNINIHVDCHSQLVHLAYMVDMFDYLYYLRQHYYFFYQSLINSIFNLNVGLAVVDVLDDGIGWNFHNFGLRRDKDLNLSLDFLLLLLNYKALDFLNNFFDNFSTDLNLDRNLHYLLNLLDLLHYSCLQSFFPDWRIDCNLFIVDQFNDFGHGDQFRSGN